jgi:hypothetical protein
MSSSQPSTRLRWLWLIPGGLLVVGLLICFAGWQYFKTTPSYALASTSGCRAARRPSDV